MVTMKKCAYKGCNSVKDSNQSKTNETFFSFPTDPTRFKVWKILAATEMEAPKYLCSKHFDRRRFISFNPRRNLLLKNAVPIPYNAAALNALPKNLVQVHVKKDTDSEFLDVITLADEKFDTVEIINCNELDVIEDKTEVNTITKPTILNQISTVGTSKPLQPTTKRKTDSKPVFLPLKKLKKIEKSTEVLESTAIGMTSKLTVNSIPIAEKNVDNEDNDHQLGSEVTTFIFKGEEYVQMPKEFYLKQKSSLLKKLDHYKSIICNLKMLLDTESDFELDEM